ncbi:MAG: DUF86 domain-containing protein [Candidatus Methanoplasma sp.]|nr:DUF86 domain-containing protein [Candidatus Methanoplasma sp.]
MGLFGSDEEDFLSNRTYQNSCSFALFQIGEAVKRMPFIITDDHPEVDWSGAARLRDVIAHRYDKIDLPRVWVVITEDVPTLRSQCEKILRSIEAKQTETDQKASL